MTGRRHERQPKGRVGAAITAPGRVPELFKVAHGAENAGAVRSTVRCLDVDDAYSTEVSDPIGSKVQM